jgi:hypothetical protein
MCIYLWNTDCGATVGGETVSRTESHVAISLGRSSVLCYSTTDVYRPLLNRHYRNRRYTFVVQAHRSTSCWRQVARLLPSLIRPTCLYSRLDSSCKIYQIAAPRLSRVQTDGSRDPWEGDHGRAVHFICSHVIDAYRLCQLICGSITPTSLSCWQQQ